MIRIINGYFIEGLFKRAIYCSDNLKIMKQMNSNSIDLICLDPPFNSNKKYDNYKENEKKELIKTQNTSFEDMWDGGLEGYRNTMLKIVRESKRILKETGIIIIHCDKYANFYIRQCLNEVFGDNHIINEIIWCYHGGGAPQHKLKQKHDTIYVYRKGKKHTFNPILIPREKIKYYKKGEKVKSEGKYLNDWWNDIPSRGTATQSKEWIGIPTQKPLDLYKRLIKLFSNEEDIVLDPFIGSGTTLVAAQELNRYYIGIDIKQKMCKAAAQRLRYPITDIIGYKIRFSELMKENWYDVQCYVCYKLNGKPNKKGADNGFDGFIPLNDQIKYPGSKANIPIQVKKGNATPDAIRAFFTRLKDSNRIWGIFVARGFSSSIKIYIEKIKFEEKINIVRYRISDLCNKNEILTKHEIEYNKKKPKVSIKNQESIESFLRLNEIKNEGNP